MSREEKDYLMSHTCRHGHRYVSHPNCYIKEQQFKERIGYLDIETNHLKANFGHVLSYCILSDTGRYTGRVLTPEEVCDWNVLDAQLMKEFCEDAMKFDKLIVYYGKDRRHDIPFLRTRCLATGADFPVYKTIKLVDMYDIAKNKLSLHSNRLQVVCEFLGIPAKQHKLDATLWLRANKGDKKALKWVWIHNKEDCDSTKLAYEKISKFVGVQNSSI